jgi:uncharacterized protein (TIGR02145 family)
MKRMIFLMLTLFILSTASMNAQVRIGGTDDPNESAVLDLNATNAANNGKLGLALPRVELTSTGNYAPLKSHVAGMTVYNTKTTGDVTPGAYYNDGSKWIRIAVDAAPVITVQPASFTFSRLKDTNGDPNAPAFTAPKLTVTAANATSYQWYKKSVNINAPDTLLTGNGADTDTYIFPTPAVGVANWGLYQFYCVVSNAYGSVKSDLAEIAVGCGAKTSDGIWLKFMCHNLGASPVDASESLDEITFDTNSTVAGGDTISSDAKGWLFQWGRVADGYQWRSSATVAGPVELPANDNPIPQGTAYGKFITASTTPYDWRTPQRDFLWRNWPDGRFPCPSEWRIPSSSEWGSIYRDGGSYGPPGAATANTWTWTTTGKGYQIKPDGSTTTLFLPAAGRRNGTGAFVTVGASGYYWSNTSGSAGVFYLNFLSGVVSPEILDNRVHGFSVRCLAE